MHILFEEARLKERQKVMGDKAMRIKLAILENDQNYLKRIVSVFSTKYADKL